MKETQEGLSLLGKSIDATITAQGKPALVISFERADISKMVYLKGNLALMNASRMNFGEEFKIEDGIRYEQGTGTMFIFRYAHEQECQNNYSVCIRNLNNNPTCRHQRLKNFIVLVFSNNSSERDRTTKKIAAVLQDQF
ncbi:MAG: hypothetical protein EHM64_01005 [Ignavibacteriae bacterium]|nr:MAG: hypothetical protein EHM64_01005 [Ignavibacteriota bacterium]